MSVHKDWEFRYVRQSWANGAEPFGRNPVDAQQQCTYALLRHRIPVQSLNRSRLSAVRSSSFRAHVSLSTHNRFSIRVPSAGRQMRTISYCCWKRVMNVRKLRSLRLHTNGRISIELGSFVMVRSDMRTRVCFRERFHFEGL